MRRTSINVYPLHWQQLANAIATGFQLIQLFERGTRRIVSGVLKRMQIAKMQSVLHSMTDYQLKQIDLRRCDISKCAEELVLEEASHE